MRAADFGSAIKGMSGPITIGADDSLLGLTDGTRSVTARVIASEYAAWRKVVDSTVARAKHKIEVDGSDLFAAVRQAGSLVRDQAPLDLVYAEGELTVSTGQEIGDGHEVLPATGRGDFALRFSPRFLADGLAATTGGTVELHYGKGGKASPIVIKDPAWPGLTVVVMSRSAQ